MIIRAADEIQRKELQLGNLMAREATETTLQYINEHMHDVMRFHGRDAVNSMMMRCIENVTIQGSILELGVHRGDKSTIFIASNINQNMHGFDSFEGLPEEMGGLNLEKGEFAISEELPKVPDNVILHKGWFDETLPDFLKGNDEGIALLHLDPDLYSSHKTAFDLLGCRIKPGTGIVFDDYFDFPQWQNHGFRAFMEFVDKNEVSFDYIAYKGARERGTENGSAGVTITSIKH